MTTDPALELGTLTLGLVLTGPGIPFAALLVRQLVEYLRGMVPPLANVDARILLFVLNAVLYVAAFAFAGQHDAAGAFAAVLTWLGCGLATMGAHKMLGDRLTVPQAGS